MWGLLPLLLILEGLSGLHSAFAFVLPYRLRTRDFSAWTPATQGDTNTIGIGGATVALPTSISAAEPNVAGFAMTTESVSAQLNNMTFHDQRLQRSGDSISHSQAGFAVSPEHWGFGIALYTPQSESGTYVSPNTGDTAKTEVSLTELRLIAARAFLDDTVAIGVGVGLAKAVRTINDVSGDTFGASFQLGFLYHSANHVLIGASYTPELRVGPSRAADFDGVMPGFNRSVVRPALLTIGSGWIPNRYFKLGVSLTMAGKTEGTSLLYDEDVVSGGGASWVPRLGASYVIAKYRNFKIEWAAGSYYESSRLSNQSDRLHFTTGLEINPSFIGLGAGFDVASGFQNYIVSVGIDLIRSARFFNIIPAEDPPPYTGFFPRITKLSPSGLPNGLVADEPKAPNSQSGLSEVTKIVTEVPSNVAKKMTGQKTSVEIEEAKKKKRGRGPP